VPGLPALDVVDVRLGVGSMVEADALAEPLAAAGFPRCAEDWCDPLRHPDGGARPDERLHGGADPGSPVELHVRVTGSPA
jgi:dephospho-CoA kinase